MAKIQSLTDISTIAPLTANNDKIEQAFQNTLSRDGSTPNDMEANLDMNGHRILNLPDAVHTQEPVTLGQAAEIAGVENPLTREVIGSYLYPRTTEETNAGVTPTYYYYPPGDVRRYGALVDGVTDDSSDINTALTVGGRVFIPAGLTAIATDLLMAVNGTELVIEAGATLSNPTATNKLITISGENCTVTGPGRVLSPAVFDGENSRRTYATLWITGTGALVRNLLIENIPRSGIHFEETTMGRVEGCRLIGNYPYADYNPNTPTTGHCGIDYDPPVLTYSDVVGITVTGCQIETCVQGFLLANYESASLCAGITIVGNTINQCWDHGIYLHSSEGAVVNGNTLISCKHSIVFDNVSGSCCGNTLYSTEPTQTNAQSLISVRDSSGAVICGNALYGLGAGIDVHNVYTTVIKNTLIDGNTIHRTGPGLFNQAIRVGLTTTTENHDNVVSNNLIIADSIDIYDGAIDIVGHTTYLGERNVVKNNHIRLNLLGVQAYGIYLLNQKYAEVSGNTISSNDVAASAATRGLIWLESTTYSEINRNNLIWVEGGDNITARGVHLTAGCDYNHLADNTFMLTAANLAGVVYINDAGTGNIKEPSFRKATANTATPSGATAYQLPVYSEAGTLLGYVPIYGSAWS